MSFIAQPTGDELAKYTEMVRKNSPYTPETLRRTNLGTANLGDRVNLEFDMIAKYVRNLTAPYLATKP